jgi:hypothetical protein
VGLVAKKDKASARSGPPTLVANIVCRTNEKDETMYNEALVNAFNADRQRNYDELERLRAQREITRQRMADDAVGSDASHAAPTRSRRHAGTMRHATAR